MKTINQQREQRSTNCGGRNEWFDVTYSVVEEADIGQSIPDYQGCGQRPRKIERSDVGRTIETTRQGSYHCWFFNR